MRDPAGTRKRQWHSGHDTKREALKALTKLLESLDSGTYVTPSRKTVGEYLTDVGYAKRATVRPGTWADYKMQVESCGARTRTLTT